MSSDITSKIQRFAAATSLPPGGATPGTKFERVQTMRGQNLAIPRYQLPTSLLNFSNQNTWTYKAVGDYTNALVTGGIQNIKIDRGTGSGRTTGMVWLHVNITNQDAGPQTLVPGPFLFQQIIWQTPGGDVECNWYPLGWWMSIIGTASMEYWQSLSDLVNSSNDYESGASIASGEVVDYYIPFIGNPFSCGEVPTRVLEGDSNIQLNFLPANQTVLTGAAANLKLNALEVVLEVEQLDQSVMPKLDQTY